MRGSVRLCNRLGDRWIGDDGLLHGSRALIGKWRALSWLYPVDLDRGAVALAVRRGCEL